MKTEKDFQGQPTKEEARNYLQRTFDDGTIKSVHITWRFDEQQADPFHHFWSGEFFIQAVKALLEGTE